MKPLIINGESMNLRDLDCFVAVAETGSVVAASRRLNRVQSGISVRLRQLEQDLGQPLFDRRGRGLTLNSAGERFLDAARDLLQRAEQARALLRDPHPAGQFRLGSMESTIAARLPALLSRFHADYPAVQLELVSQPSWTTLRAVERGELDAAFVSADAVSDQLSRQPVFREELVLVSARDHRPVKKPADLGDTPLLVFAPDCAYRARLERWAQQDGGAPRRRIELHSYHVMLSCAAAGTGVGLVPQSVLDVFADRDRLALHRLPKAIARDDTCLVWHPARSGANLAALRALIQAPPVQ